MPRRLVIFFLLFWLPQQGWGVSVMPFTRHGGIMWMQSAADMSCHSGNHARSADTTTTQPNCDSCGFCHLAGAPAATVAARLFSPLTGGDAPLAVELPPPDAVPDTFYRPPRI
jgi:hypothetical protein